jgi:dTDP-4-dehydrorhamnose reductase
LGESRSASEDGKGITILKIAIIGGTGLLGSNLVNIYSNHDVRSFSRSQSINVSDIKNQIINFDNLNYELSNYFNLWKPNIIINTIAIVNLQKCENDYDVAQKVNCDLASELSMISKKYNCYFIHISTDHFYDDNLIFHSELDKVSLKNNYAKTKFNAEKEVVLNNSQALVVRTNIVGFRRNKSDSFLEWLISSLKNNKKIHLFSNYYTSPISTIHLGKLLLICYKNQLSGTYNISSSIVIDKYSFGVKVAEKFGFSIANIAKSKVINQSNENLQRALTLGLDVSKIECALNLKMPNIDQTIDTLYQDYKN